MSTTEEDPWSSWIDEALVLADPEHTPRLLAELLLSDHRVLLGADVEHPSRLPSGQPKRAVRRRAAAALDEWKARPAESDARAFLAVVADWARSSSPQRSDQHGDDELHRARDEAAAAAAAAASVDPVVELLMLHTYSLRCRDVFLFQESLEVAEQATERVELLLADPPADSTLHRALPAADWLPSPSEIVRTIAVTAHMRAAVAARFLRDYERAASERDLQVVAARAIEETQPSRLADALGQRAALARDLGDIAVNLRLLDEQGQVAERHPTDEVMVIRFRSLGGNAKFLQDWEAERVQQFARLRRRMDAEGMQGVVIEPATVEPLIAKLAARHDQRLLTNIGNIAFELARNLIESGRVAASQKYADEASGWLDCCTVSWQDIAMNGRIATEFRKLEVRAVRGEAGDPRTVGRSMIESSRAWRRPRGQRRAARQAVEYGAAGDPVILERLIELRDEAPVVDAAHLDAAIALWHLRAGDELQSRDGGPDQWRTAAEKAAAATSGLSVQQQDGSVVPLDPRAFVEAVQWHAGALRRLRDSGAPDQGGVDSRVPAELAVRVSSLPGIARRLATAGTADQRAYLTELYSGWLEETAVLAVDEGDSFTFDATAELARRDHIGAILRGMTADPDTPEQIALLARELTSALSVVVEDVDMQDGEEPLSRPDPTTPENRARSFAGQLTQTLDVVGQVISPVARTLFDPDAVLQVEMDEVLGQLRRPLAAVLSLWHLNSGSTGRIARRCAIRSVDGTVSHHLDIVDSTADLGALHAGMGDDELSAILYHLPEVLLPKELRDALAEATIDAPMELLVVPTGLLDIPFAALQVSAQDLLLDLATITIVQSLQTARALAETITPSDSTPTAVATYDLDRFLHTRAEFDALARRIPEVVEARTLDELDATLRSAERRGGPGLLALGLHGHRGADGWSQSKLLPSGEELTTGHALQWHLPGLVVAASCNTNIRGDDGGELGGFPLAFQLRGAATVIGTLDDIEDEATAQIMEIFYACFMDEVSVAEALRRAQREWIRVRPDQLPYLRKWALLVAYGLPGSAVR